MASVEFLCFHFPHYVYALLQFGDHLLECSHDPMRIHCHDALVDNVCPVALSQSHLFRASKVSCKDHSRSGDAVS